MSHAKFIQVPMDDYVECRLCRANVHKSNDGPAIHAARQHPRAKHETLYYPAPPRMILDESSVKDDV